MQNRSIPKRVHFNKYAGMGDNLEDKLTKYRVKTRVIHNGCLRKKVYLSESEANRRVKKLGKDAKSYRCPTCKNWHVAHKNGAPKKESHIMKKVQALANLDGVFGAKGRRRRK